MHATLGTLLKPLPADAAAADERSILNEPAFARMISLERKRSERSRKPFVLLLLEMSKLCGDGEGALVAERILPAISAATRETDVTGWYRENIAVGVMFTEIALEDRDRVVAAMINRVRQALCSRLTPEQFEKLTFSFHVFPEEWDQDGGNGGTRLTLYPELSKRADRRKALHGMKRLMDVAGSLLALICLSPIFLFIAAAIKLTSKGPVFFRQQRIGQYGEPFVFLKFRSMYVNNNSAAHQEYVKKLIAGTAQAHATDGNGAKVYKLTRDPRITKIGAIIRKASLDELPQFINVLRGEMSLVGPRPPVPYEVEAYDVWHRRRLLEAKPGITGLWQVSGRCRVKFDDMVRLDLKYARDWTPWMDIKILARTPGAVVTGEGAL